VVLDDGKPAKDKYQGTLTWDGKAIDLKPNEKSGVLEASGPKLDADITEVGYVVTGPDAKTFRGSLHLPRGGTKELAASAKESADVDVQGKVGPHGGKVQVVGKDRVELVANPDNGELRVYVLDADLQPVAVGDRKITVAVVSDKPQVVVLVPEPKGQYASAKLASTAEPVKVTVSIRRDDSTHVVLVDHRPRAVVVVGRSAPRVKIMVKGAVWAPTVVVVDDGDRHHHTKIHIKNKRGKGKGNGGSQVKVHVR
jgi:outer membrane lipoprotein SlyB